jgi:hypothetical protein
MVEGKSRRDEWMRDMGRARGVMGEDEMALKRENKRIQKEGGS